VHGADGDLGAGRGAVLAERDRQRDYTQRIKRWYASERDVSQSGISSGIFSGICVPNYPQTSALIRIRSKPGV